MEELPDAVDVTDAVSPAAEIEENKSLKSPLNAKHKTTNVRIEEPSRSAPTESTSKSPANTATSANTSNTGSTKVSSLKAKAKVNNKSRLWTQEEERQ